VAEGEWWVEMEELFHRDWQGAPLTSPQVAGHTRLFGQGPQFVYHVGVEGDA